MASFPGQKGYGPSVPVIASPSVLPNAEVGANYSFQFVGAGGVGPYTFSPPSIGQFTLSPGGLLFNSAPLTGTGGLLSFSVTITDQLQNSTTAGFQLTTLPAPAITTTSPLPGAQAGNPYSVTFAATGGTPPYTWAATSGLPSWATLNATTGVLSGTPIGAETDSITIQATDSYNVPVPTPPVTFSLSVTATSGVGPQAMWGGYQDTQSVAFEWWNPTSQTAWGNGVYTADITNNVMTVTSVTSGAVFIGQALSGTGIPAGVKVLSQITGIFGTGKYGVSPCPNIPAGTTITGFGNPPDYYHVYENLGSGFVLSPGQTSPPLTFPGVIPTNGAPPNTHNPVIPYVRRNLNPGTNILFAVKAVTGGVESAFGPTLSMATLVNGPSATPTPPANTSWEQGMQLAGTPVVVNSQATLLTALQNANPAGPNVIALDPTGTYAIPNVNGYRIQPGTQGGTQIFTGTGGWTTIISTEAPEYKAFIGSTGGKLPAFNATAGSPVWQVVPCTAVIPVNATSATLSTAWAQKSGWYYVWFEEGSGAGATIEERWVVFTQGQQTIDWHLNNGNYPNPGLVAQASATLRVFYEPSVTPWDAFTNVSMPSIDMGATIDCFGINIPPGTTKVRFVGINIKTTGTGATGSTIEATGYIHFTNSQEPSLGPPVTPAESIYFDRCMWGNDTGSATYQFCTHGLGWINCNHLLVSQCYGYGVATNYIPSGSDSNNFTCNGANHLWRSTYLSTVSECHIIGGIFMDNVNPPSDIHFLNISTHKPLGWLQGAFVAVSTWTLNGTPQASSVGANGGILVTAWQFPSGTCNVALSADPLNTATFVNGQTAFTLGTALTKTDTLGMNPQGDPAHGNAGGLVPYWQFGREVKNHLEQKSGFRCTYNGVIARNCWVGKQPGYHGAPFAMATRDQQLSNNGAALYTDCCPYSQTLDIDIQNCISLNCPAAMVTFTSDPSVGSYTARLRYKNNLAWISTSSLGEQMSAFWIIGPVSDIIIDQCTIITNQQIDQTTLGVPLGVHFSWFNALSGSNANLVPFSPFSYTPYPDRLTITNTIMDSGPVGNTANPAFFQDAVVPIPFESFPNITFNKNVTINDSNAGYPNLAATHIPYINVGFQNFNVSNLPPLNISDWNVVNPGTANLNTASTIGGPVGATFSTTPVITTTSLPNAVVGTAYAQTLTAAGGAPPYTWNLVSATPNRGLALSMSPGGTLQGTLQHSEANSVTVQVNDSAGGAAQVTYALGTTVSGALAVVTSSLPNASAGGFYGAMLAASGGTPPYLWTIGAVTGSTTFTMERNGLLTAAPTAAGANTFTVTVTDNTNATATANLSVTVDTSLRINLIDNIDGVLRIPQGYAGTLYGGPSARFTAGGGTAPYTWSLQSGSLNGLTVGSTGTLSGTLGANAGAVTGVLKVTDNASNTATIPILGNIVSKDQVTRPSYNTGSGFFVHSDGTLRDPNGFRFYMRGINRNNPFQGNETSSWRTLQPNTARYGSFTLTSANLTSYISAMQTDHIGTKEFTLFTGFVTQPTGTIPAPSGNSVTLSGDQNIKDLANVVAWYVTNQSSFAPLMNNLCMNLANEFGPPTGVHSAASVQYLNMHAAVPASSAGQGAAANIPVTGVSVSTTAVITVNSNAATNPFANSTMCSIFGATGTINGIVGNITSTGGVSGAWTVTTDIDNSGSKWTSGGNLFGGAVGIMRAANYTCPISIDTGNFGSLEANPATYAAQINNSDPMHNCIFNVHQYNAYSPFQATVASVTTGANTVLHLNSTAAHHPFDDFVQGAGTFFEYQVQMASFQGTNWTTLNGQTPLVNGTGNFGGSAGAWTVTLPINTTGFSASTYVANSGVVYDFSHAMLTAQRYAALRAQGVCLFVEEFGPQLNSGPTPTLLSLTDVIGAQEAYKGHWIYWALDDNSGVQPNTLFGMTNPTGVYTTPSTLTVQSGQPFIMHPRMSTYVLATPPPSMLP